MTDLLYKQVAASTELQTDQGEFTAIAAAYSVDRANEIIRPGAFTSTIGKWLASGRDVPLHYDHGGKAEDVIGSVWPGSMAEREDGLYVAGKVDIDSGNKTALAAWRSMKRNRVGLSFGYLVVDAAERSDGVTELRELDLFEVSITPAPANPDARILSTKHERPDLAAEGSWADVVLVEREPEDDPIDRKADELLAIAAKSARRREPVEVATFPVE